MRFRKSDIVFVLAVCGVAAAVNADPRPREPVAPSPGVRAPNPFAPPAGKEGRWVFRPGLPGSVHPWLGRPIELDVPEEPGDIGGAGGIGGPG